MLIIKKEEVVLKSDRDRKREEKSIAVGKITTAPAAPANKTNLFSITTNNLNKSEERGKKFR